MRRILPPQSDRMTPDQSEAYEAIRTGPRGVVRGPVALWLHSPVFATHAQKLGAFCKYQTSLPTRLSELAILCCAVHWGAKYAIKGHIGPAKVNGLTEAFIQHVVDEKELPADGIHAQEDERAVVAFCREALRAGGVADDTFAVIRETLGEAGVIELLGILGYYTMISLTDTIIGLDHSELDGMSNALGEKTDR